MIQSLEATQTRKIRDNDLESNVRKDPFRSKRWVIHEKERGRGVPQPKPTNRDTLSIDDLAGVQTSDNNNALPLSFDNNEASIFSRANPYTP